MAGASRTKPQQTSITAFFGAGAKSPSPVAKRKAEDTPKKTQRKKKEEEEDAEEEPKKRKVATPVKKASVKAKRVVMADSEEDDVDMAEPQTEEAEEEQSPVTKGKPGRRRLRQRVVDDDEDEEDDELSFPPGKKKEEVVEIESEEEKEKEPAKTQKQEDKAVSIEKEEEEDDDGDEDYKEEEQEEEDDDAEEEDEEEEEEPPAKQKKAAPKKASAVASTGFFAVKPAKKEKAAAAATTDTSVTLDDDVESIPYTALASLFSKIEAVTARLVIQDLLTNFFREVMRKAPQDLLACIYLCVCTDLAPPFENLKIGIGDAILMKAIGEATGTAPKFIKEMYQKEGDLGKVAQNARSKQHTLSFASMKPAADARPKVLSVPDVYNQFVKIAKMTGNNSQQQKCSIIKNLLVKCEKDKKATSEKGEGAAEAAKYIIRGLQGKLRIGLAEKSILIGLTYAFMLEKDAKDKEKQEKALAQVKKAFAECPSYNALVKAFQDVQETVETRPFLKVSDFTKVAELCVLTPGTPVSPMLARPTKAYAMVFDRFQGQPFTCEYKYDGERAQIHILPNGEIAIFSRNFENSTERFPDVKLMIQKAAKKSQIKSCIVDAEVVAVDKATNKRLPFQVLSTRSRKNVKVEDIKVPVCIYAFDLLYLNGESMLQEQLTKRRSILKEMFEVEDGSFEFATSMDVDGVMPGVDDAEAMEVAVDKVRTFLEEAVKENCEGLMVKTLEKEATYEPANRSHKWLKLKKDYLDGIGDSTDLVPIGAFHGRGKRTGVYGAYLLACYDPDTEMFQAITKLGTGLSDEVLKEFSNQLKEKVVDRPPSDYAIADGIKPDVWFEPSCVWEILGADLSISPKYTAAMGLVAKDKGISLRFPRFIRIREDKNPAQATTSHQIADLYRAQGLATVGGDDDDDDMLI
ncbi:hypothetical protein Poli38472_005772 [Pythium oligandrum]|uniref:DNA ligase n=1 Tax=Pythium oligandrum TaxID=41045 RepID=A0A8K1CRL1_PYTOL|nr:hypothetical protein Poli38472_005772 [Pythium oligandrum]|eukprot:TMW68304.1 hypothetical protein Poli38472_005772 [Pythium oligandrum]